MRQSHMRDEQYTLHSDDLYTFLTNLMHLNKHIKIESLYLSKKRETTRQLTNDFTCILPVLSIYDSVLLRFTILVMNTISLNKVIQSAY